MNGIIIILGSPNNDRGELLTIARERLDQGIFEYRNNPDFKIIPTGGFGEHFNTTDLPHAHYAKQYLISSGVPTDDILDFAISSYTMEDATASKTICDKFEVTSIVVVTSDFHMERAKLIFDHVYSGYKLSYSSSKTNISSHQLEALREHEMKSVNQLKQKIQT